MSLKSSLKQNRYLLLLLLLLMVTPMGYAEPNFFVGGNLLVILDAGHGGVDPGAVGKIPDQAIGSLTIYEKDINLAIVERIRDSLERSGLSGDSSSIEVLLTREGDEDLSLWRRALIANQAEIEDGQRKVFLSIHANAAPDGVRASGFEIWRFDSRIDRDVIISGIKDTAIDGFAQKTNRELNQELVDAEYLLATSIASALEARLGVDHGTRSRGIKESRYYVLEYTYMPSVIIEVGFMTDSDELTRLIDERYQQLIADAIVSALWDFATQ